MAAKYCEVNQARALILGCLCIFAMGGMVFGVSAIYSEEYNESLYAGTCSQSACPHSGTACCAQQLYMMSLFSSIGFFVADGAAAPWGEVVDRAGPRASLACASAVSIVGLILLSSAAFVDSSGTAFDPHFHGSATADVLASAGLIFIGGAGPGVFNGVYVGCLNLADTTRSAFFEATLATLVAGCFDASSLVFNFFSLVSPILPLEVSFLTWAVICVVFTMSALFFGIRYVHMPQEGEVATAAPATEASKLLEVKFAKEDPATSSTAAQQKKKDFACGKSFGSSLLGVITGNGKTEQEKEEARLKEAALVEEAQKKAAAEAARHTCCGHSGIVADVVMPVVHTVGSWHNILLVLQMGLINLACSHYLVSHGDYLRLLFGADVSVDISSTFDIAFPVLGFCAALGVSPLLTAKAQWLPFVVLTVMANTWVILTMIPTVATQYLAVFVFGPMRTLQWASFYRIVGANADLYEPSAVGRTLGYNGLFIAIIGDALSPPLMGFAQGVESDEAQSTRYLQLKIMLLCLIMPITIAVPVYLHRITSK